MLMSLCSQECALNIEFCLGYAVHNDFERLLHSYKEVEAFRVCESVLDLQKVFDKEANKGGLSGLAKVIMYAHAFLFLC
jgi:hypothetical protein